MTIKQSELENLLKEAMNYLDTNNSKLVQLHSKIE